VQILKDISLSLSTNIYIYKGLSVVEMSNVMSATKDCVNSHEISHYVALHSRTLPKTNYHR
jgi:hypothetical protein